MSDSHKPLLSTQGDDATVNLERQYVDNVNLEVGLTGATVEERFARFGPNELVEEEVNMFLKFLTYFWGPMPIMIWVAVIIELAKACAGQGGWEDFAVLLVLQILNGCVGFIEEKNAGNAIAALKKQLAPMCRVKRDGKWTQIESRLLVPGDLLKVKLGDIVPADAIILDGEPLQVDQAALTGESLPVTIHPGGKIKMGSAIKRGEIEAVVVATGKDTFFGKAADMMNIDDAVGRFQKVLFKITLGLLGISSVLTLIIFVDLLVDGNDVLRAVSVCVVLLVASIPIAMQVVCTSTMAVGSRRLAQKKVIVARLGAIEELAGMTILCSDKTGTLTLNKLSLREPIRMGDMEESELIFYSALAAVQDAASQDAIDLCICNAVHEGDKSKLQHFTVLKYIPFNPTDKRTESTVKAPDGSVFKITKGAPQVILRMAFNAPEIQDQVDAAVQDLADRGFRALGVAISYTGVGEEPKWEFQGVLSLFDPPRLDTKDTIEKANENGVEVKMVTGDQTAIAKETCRELGMGTNILNTDVLVDPAAIGPGMDIDDIILNSNGFAEVFPEHKFEIVDRIRKRGFVVGMTGDGVNDAPALKRADIGIAVEGATDAAKAAADIVLIEPGLSVIIDAILRSRKIFQRMRNYSIYRIACTIELLFFFFFAVLTIKPAHFFGGDGNVEKSFTLPVIALVVITILNDGTIISIAHDKVIPENRPQKWDLTEVVIVSNCLGLVACLSSMILLVFGMQGGGTENKDNWFVPFMAKDTSQGISYGEIMTMMYLKVSLSDFLTVFSARTTSFFWERRPGYALAAACVVATGSSTGLALGWPFKDAKATVTMTPLDGKYAVLTVWVYCLIWFVLTDFVKVILYKVLAAVRTPEEDIVEALHKKGRLTNAMENDRLTRRADGVRRETSSMLGATRQDVGAMQKRLQQLEAADKAKAEQLKSLMSEISTLKAQMSGPSAGTAAEE